MVTFNIPINPNDTASQTVEITGYRGFSGRFLESLGIAIKYTTPSETIYLNKRAFEESLSSFYSRSQKGDLTQHTFKKLPPEFNQLVKSLLKEHFRKDRRS